MRSLVLNDRSPRKRGEAQGEAFRQSIRELAEIRWELLARRSPIKDADALRELALAHVGALERQDPELGEEFHGVAEASGIPPESLVVLNNYTDIRDVGPEPEGGDGGCSIVYGRGIDGPVVGQTWDMHRSCPVRRAGRGRPGGSLGTRRGGGARQRRYDVGYAWPAPVRRGPIFF